MAELMKVLTCPVCLELMKTPILQCKIGHSLCGECVSGRKLKECPQCRGPLTKTRNYQLEQTIASLPKDLQIPCTNAAKGCKHLVTATQSFSHEIECKHRRFMCEGKRFAGWRCEWTGSLEDLEAHFKQAHKTEFEFKSQKELKMDLTKEKKDVQLISFFNGSQFFYYKHRVDVAKQKAFWTFQFIGPKELASRYYYEFEINSGPIRKLKVTEICDNDVTDANFIFSEGRCVVVPFKTVKSFLNENGRLSIKFRIMSAKKHSEASK